MAFGTASWILFRMIRKYERINFSTKHKKDMHYPSINYFIGIRFAPNTVSFHRCRYSKFLQTNNKKCCLLTVFGYTYMYTCIYEYICIHMYVCLILPYYFVCSGRNELHTPVHTCLCGFRVKTLAGSIFISLLRGSMFHLGISKSHVCTSPYIHVQKQRGTMCLLWRVPGDWMYSTCIHMLVIVVFVIQLGVVYLRR